MTLSAGPKWSRKAFFRSNPDYALVSRSSFPEKELLQFGDLVKDPEFYGLLVPRNGSSLSIKAVQSGDAQLFSHLQQARQIPEDFFQSHAAPEAYIGQLLLDRILEIEVGEAFLSGPALLKETPRASLSTEETSISDRALLYGARLKLRDSQELTGRLYAFNRIPAGVAQHQAWLNRHSVKQYLGLGGDSYFEDFQEQLPTEESSCWLHWARVRAKRSVDSPFKLYFCVYPEALPAVFYPCASTAAQNGAFGFKVGADRIALNRPDKFVAYFEHRTDLQACISDLAQVLEGCKPHELPFTGALAVPTLTWGVDPPGGPKPVQWLRDPSWRVWVARKLASALILAADNGCTPIEAIEFAKSRVALDGVDPRTWAPEGVTFL